MTGRVQPARVPCTYAGCNFAFNTVQEMRKHKTNYPNHDYCSKCDEDFEDEERLLLHKIKSDDHVVCPVCGLDFKSEGGRDSHIRQVSKPTAHCRSTIPGLLLRSVWGFSFQFHRAEQSLVCCGCKAVFKSASGLMRHIEEHECSQITPVRLLREQSKKLLIKEILSNGPRENLPIVPDPTDFDDIDGGVKLNQVELRNREAMLNQPRFGEDDPTARVSTFLALKHWPALGARAGDPDEGADLMQFSPDKKGGFKGKELGVAIAGSEDAGDANPGLFAKHLLADAGQTLRMVNENWDATKFFNSFSGQYVCPSCGDQFGQLNAFQEHVLNKSRGKISAQYVPCFEIFQ